MKETCQRSIFSAIENFVALVVKLCKVLYKKWGASNNNVSLGWHLTSIIFTDVVCNGKNQITLAHPSCKIVPIPTDPLSSSRLEQLCLSLSSRGQFRKMCQSWQECTLDQFLLKKIHNTTAAMSGEIEIPQSNLKIRLVN